MGKHAEPVCVALEGLVHGGHPERRSGSGGCASGWNCVVAAVLESNVENKKITNNYQ